MSLPVLLGLIVCNAIWATNSVMGKILMRDLPALQVSWLRYGSALLAALVGWAWLRARGSRYANYSSLGQGRWIWVVSLGLLTFFGSSILQYMGLWRSSAMANSIIVATEPLFAALLAWFFLRETLSWKQSFAFALSLVGFFLLSNLHPGDIAGSLALFNVGNLFLLCVMPLEAMYSIISRRLVGQLGAVTLFVLALAVGFSAFTTYLILTGTGLPPLAFTGTQALTVLWLGPLGTAITYIFWTIALEDAPVAAVSLTLFVQPILGTGFGAIFLGERLQPWQMIGGGLILAALILQTTHALRRPS